MRNLGWVRDNCPECGAFCCTDQQEKHQQWHELQLKKFHDLAELFHRMAEAQLLTIEHIEETDASVRS
jgi:hypothetical protein